MDPTDRVVRMPIALSERACEESVENLNQLLTDTMALRDLYTKHHWQGAGVAEMTLVPRPPKGREEVPVQISRLLHADEIVLKESRTMARLADPAHTVIDPAVHIGYGNLDCIWSR